MMQPLNNDGKTPDAGAAKSGIAAQPDTVEVAGPSGSPPLDATPGGSDDAPFTPRLATAPVRGRTERVGPGVQALIRRVDLFTLRLFLSVVEEGQIGRAAWREHTVPSAATRRIQELEELAGTRLFDRGAKGVLLTPAGQVVARHARAVLATLDAMGHELTAVSDGDAGYLSIAATRLQLVYFLATEIGAFVRLFPRVEVDLREELYLGTLRALRTGEVELAVYDIRGPDIDIEGIESRECRRDGLVAMFPADHPLAQASSVSLETLLAQDLIGTRPESCLMANLAQAANKSGRELRLKRRVDTIEAARSLVSAGLGVALQPASGAEFMHDRNRVVNVPVEGEWATLSYRVGWRAGRPLTPPAVALVEQLTAGSAGN